MWGYLAMQRVVQLRHIMHDVAAMQIFAIKTKLSTQKVLSHCHVYRGAYLKQMYSNLQSTLYDH